MTTRTLAQQLLEIFGGNPYYALGSSSNPSLGASNYWYEPINAPLTEELIDRHLDGQIVLGSYPVNAEDNTVRWLGWDIDAQDDLQEARRLVVTITNTIENLPFVVEYSGGKGYHILLFLDEPMPASQAKAYSESVRDLHSLPKQATKGHPHVECYPKQAKVDASAGVRKYGNLLKIPLGKHLRTHSWSKFVDMDNGWEEGPLLPAQELLEYRVSPEELIIINEDTYDAFGELVNTLVPFWIDGSRHQLALYLSGYLSSAGVNLEEAETIKLIERICDKAGDADVYNRVATVHDTYRKIREGATVAGYTRLGEMLPSKVMAKVVDTAGDLAKPDIAQKIERILKMKMPMYKKEEKVSKLIWAYLSDEANGQPIRTELDHLYWFENDTKTLYKFGTQSWRSRFLLLLGLYRGDNFGSHVMGRLTDIASQLSPKYDIHRGAHWDKENNTLMVHFGGSTVYKLDGQNIEEVPNGTQGVIFEQASFSHSEPAKPDWDNPYDLWELLVDDLNFEHGSTAPIPGEQQKELLKAWILGTYFPEELPTRPLLTLLGDSGSGKTTAARRIVRTLENPATDVQGLQTDKQDAWRTLLEQYRIFCLDNLEDVRVRWLPEDLDKIATGNHITIRQLYATNEAYNIIPNCYIIMTAVNMPFSKATVYNRMLTLNMEKLTDYIPERVFIERVTKLRNRALGDLLLKLNQVILTLKGNANKHTGLTSKLRLSDFATFCYRISDSEAVVGEKLKLGLNLLRKSQERALSQSTTSIYPILEDWVNGYPEQAGKWHTAGELYADLSKLARDGRRDFRWRDSRGLAQHMLAMADALASGLGMEVNEKYKYEHGRDIKGYRFGAAKEILEQGKKIAEGD